MEQNLKKNIRESLKQFKTLESLDPYQNKESLLLDSFKHE